MQLVEKFDLFFIVSDLQIAVVDDDGTFQHGRILHDEIAELVERHRFDIDAVFLDDLGSLGDDVVGSVIRAGDQVFDLVAV